jgi:hypothetical protein
VLPAPVAGAAIPAPQDVLVASVSIDLSTSAGYPYFRSWYYTVNRSGKLTVNDFSPLTQTPPRNVTYSAQLGVTAEVRSIRANEFKVPS